MSQNNRKPAPRRRRVDPDDFDRAHQEAEEATIFVFRTPFPQQEIRDQIHAEEGPVEVS